METVVISLGGSLLNPGEPDIDYLKKIAALLKSLSKEYQLGVVTGGGHAARVYADAMRKLGSSEFMADEDAIGLTRQNAYLVIAALGEDAYPSVLEDFDEAGRAAISGKIVVMGGTIPGITTDADAALLAERLGAKRVVNLSTVDGIYDEDPRANHKAKKFSKLSFEELVELASKSDKRRAGEHFVFDLVACKIIARSKIETHFVGGKDLEEAESAIRGKKHKGTVVSG